MFYYIILYCIILYYTILYYIIFSLYIIILCYVMFFYNNDYTNPFLNQPGWNVAFRVLKSAGKSTIGNTARYPGTGRWGSEQVQRRHLGAHGIQGERSSEFSGSGVFGPVSIQSKSHISGRSSRSALKLRPGEGGGMGHSLSQCHGLWVEESSRWRCSGVERKFHQSLPPPGEALVGAA